MKIYSVKNINQIKKEIKNGHIVVLPTDTIYGVCCDAFNKKSVEKIYELRKRDKNKPCIVLILKINDLKKFEIKLDEITKEFLKNVWANKISVMLDCDSKKLSYLHRGTKKLAFRIPDNKFLLKLLSETGPIIAPSANIQNKKPPVDIKEAEKYFNDSTVYVDGGKLKNSASCLINIEKNFDIKILRKGKISKNRYFFMRHGEALSNVKKIISSRLPEKFYNPLTEKGKKQILKKISKLKKLKIDLIMSSPFLRTKQTAQIIKKYLNHSNVIKKLRIIYDERLREIDCGIFEGKNSEHYNKFAKKFIDRYKNKIPGGESMRNVKIRMLKVIFELEKKYQNKNILIISHGHPLFSLYGAMKGYTEEEVSNRADLINGAHWKISAIKKTKFL